MFLYVKLSNLYGVLQKILYCDIRIPESQELFTGLLNSVFTSDAQRNLGYPKLT